MAAYPESVGDESKKFSGLHTATLTLEQFKKLSSFIYNECGIRIPDSKKTMLEVRLRKRLRVLQIFDFDDYLKYLFSDKGMSTELVDMIDVVTTNKTDFFREPKQFPFLTDVALPEIYKNMKLGASRKLKVWSAGCSTGEEPYTLAMVLSDIKERQIFKDFDFTILGTDISTDVLKKAASGIYDLERVIPVSQEFKKKYLLKSKDQTKKLVRIVPELRAKIKFDRLNFMEDDFRLNEKMDVIFCRNVIIYFDRQTQEKIIGKLTSHLNKDGYLFVGHSETLFNMDLTITQLAPSTYKKIGF